MPVKIARSTPRASFGLRELLVASHISRLASRDAAKSLLSTLVSESSGECRSKTHAGEARGLRQPLQRPHRPPRGHRDRLLVPRVDGRPRGLDHRQHHGSRPARHLAIAPPSGAAGELPRGAQRHLLGMRHVPRPGPLPDTGGEPARFAQHTPLDADHTARHPPPRSLRRRLSLRTPTFSTREPGGGEGDLSVAVALTNYETWPLTSRCVERVQADPAGPSEIVVVD